MQIYKHEYNLSKIFWKNNTAHIILKIKENTRGNIALIKFKLIQP